VIRRIDVLIKDGIVYDGSLDGPYSSDIAISGDVISGIGSFQTSEAAMVIDAEGLAVSPGFIDAHAHSDFTILADPRAEGKVSQGVTTEINGNCGMSAAPLFNKAFERRQEDLRDLGIRERWNTLDEYFALVRKRGAALNLASLAGHGNIRGSVMGYDDRMPSEEEFSEMSTLLKSTLYEGAIGLSTGLIYPPGVYAETEELIRLSKFLKKKDLIYTSHMRSEGEMLVESVAEIIKIAREADIKTHISHIKTAGKNNWSKADEVISLIEEARASGLRLTCDRYPYTASSTDLDSLLPAWTYEGGNEEELKRLMNPVDRARISKELQKQAGDKDYWKTVIISTVDSEKNAWMEGRTVAEISLALQLDEIDTLFMILLDEKLRIGAIFLSMSEENLKKFFSLPYCMVGSDSSSRSFDGPTRKGKPHPRTFGTFPRFLGKYARDDSLMGLPEAIHRSTALPARTFGLMKRGSIKYGMYADIVVFDPKTIIDRATFDDPYKRSAGIPHVLVNGVPVIKDGKFAGNYPGRALRKNQSD
jgi:N-acyl-D-amino-acid deacylase